MTAGKTMLLLTLLRKDEDVALIVAARKDDAASIVAATKKDSDMTCLLEGAKARILDRGMTERCFWQIGGVIC